MEEGWKLVYFKCSSYLSTLVQELLQENGIQAVVLNRENSSYATFGEIEVNDRDEGEVEANRILKYLNSGKS